METIDERKESEEVELYNRLSKKLDIKAVNMKGLLLLLVAPLIVAGWDQKHEKVRLREVQVNKIICLRHYIYKMCPGADPPSG